MSTQPSGAGVAVALRRVVVGYRIVGVVWLWLLIGMALRESRDEWTLVVATGLLATLWTVITVVVAERRPVILRSPWWVVADVGVTVALILMSSMARPNRGFLGGYPFSTVLVAGFGSGYAGAFASAIVLSIVSARVLIGGEAINSALVYLAGAGVTVWGFDVIRRNDAQRRALEQALAAEEAERARSQERADTAAALHDSVLQTLALIQRRSDDPAAVASLARRQERDLRDWLTGRGRLGGARETTFGAALADAAAEIERDYPITIEAVTVGDAALDERLAALVAAAREAMVNTAKHAGVPSASVYAEVAGGWASVFVRDRGEGFDLDNVPEDRRGIRESIQGRLERIDGTATVRSSPGSGAEVELRAPLVPQTSPRD